MTADLRAPRALAATGAGVPFEAFYADEARSVVGLAIALTGDRNAGEEIAQEAFTRAYRDWDRIGAYERPGAWVRRVVANLAISRWRRRASEQRALSRLRGQRGEPTTFEPRDHHFWQEVRALPRRQALVVAMHYVDDRSVADIAACLDMPEGTVKSLLHRARTRLADQLREDGR